MVGLTLAGLRRRIADVRQFMDGPATPNLIGWKHEIYLTPTEWQELRSDQEFFEALRNVLGNPRIATITSFQYQGVKVYVPA